VIYADLEYHVRNRNTEKNRSRAGYSMLIHHRAARVGRLQKRGSRETDGTGRPTAPCGGRQPTNHCSVGPSPPYSRAGPYYTLPRTGDRIHLTPRWGVPAVLRVCDLDRRPAGKTGSTGYRTRCNKTCSSTSIESPHRGTTVPTLCPVPSPGTPDGE
jgi:hypothetical protein